MMHVGRHFMRASLPTQDEVFEAFLMQVNAARRSTYVVADRPDESERGESEIDYVATDAPSGRQLAVEVSSVWRNPEAGRDDRPWRDFVQTVETWLNGRVPGTFHLYADLRIPAGLNPQIFAGDLMTLFVREDATLTRFSESGRALTFRVCGMDVCISKAAPTGSEVALGQRASDADLAAVSDFVRAILTKRSPKLQHHKARGRETWLLLYNTILPLLSPSILQGLIGAQLSDLHAHIDHVAIMAGNPPHDVRLTVIR